MNPSSKNVVSRARQRVRIINFNDTITEGYVFVAYGQRISDLLNDDREFLPVESASGEVRVISKRAIMEIEMLEGEVAKKAEGGDVVSVISGNAYDLLGAPANADDSVVRAIYLDRIASLDVERLEAATQNADLLQAADHLRSRYTAAYDAILQTRQIEAIAAAVRASQTKRRRFGEE
jgi:hypothetical protein